MSTTPIGDHALISDCRSTALIDRSGSVEWLCWPRVDAPSVFGRLLDPTAGHWSIAPVGDAVVQRRYLDRSMVLETHSPPPRERSSLLMLLSLGPESGATSSASAPRVCSSAA